MNVKIKAKLREIGKKSELKRYRKEGLIPAVIYGEGKEGTNILLDNVSFKKSYRKTIGGVAIFEIEVDGNTYSTFIKDKQIHPVSRDMVHIDFVELHKGKPITLEVPLNFVGVAKGAQEGGVVEYLHRSIEISCLPKDIPDEIEVDISNVGVGEALHFAEIDIPDTITTTMAEDTALVSVKEPQMKLAAEKSEEGEELEDGTLTEEVEGDSAVKSEEESSE